MKVQCAKYENEHSKKVCILRQEIANDLTLRMLKNEAIIVPSAFFRINYSYILLLQNKFESCAKCMCVV